MVHTTSRGRPPLPRSPVQRGLNVSAEKVEIYNGPQPLQRIARRRKRPQPLVRIEKTGLLCHRHHLPHHDSE
jgi:hypothetical protein